VTALAAQHKPCDFCGHVFVPRKLWHAYCSPRCRLHAFRRQARETHRQSTLPTEPPKINAARPSLIQEVPINTHAFHPQNRGVRAPHHVIETVVFNGRVWRKVSSSDGVVCEVGTLRARALRENGAT
jgi:hypothetical protein